MSTLTPHRQRDGASTGRSGRGDPDRARRKRRGKRRHDISLYLMAVPGIVFFLVFSYVPMLGIIVAFKSFNPVQGILRSPWAGLTNFDFLFASGQLVHVLWNTVFLNTLFIVATNLAAITLAILFNEIHIKATKRVAQSVILLPYFMSWMVVSLMLQELLSGIGGQGALFNSLLGDVGLHGLNWYADPTPWPWILTIVKLWQGAGYLSIIYLAAITSISDDVYEAAMIDGATRARMAWRITLPLLTPTTMILLILSVGRIFYGDFGMIYGIIGDNGPLFPTTDVIDTYVFRALRDTGDISGAAAAGLFQSVCGFVLVLVANWIARRHAPESAIF